MSQNSAALAILLLALLVLGCGGGGGGSAPDPVVTIATVEITDTAILLNAIESAHQFSAVARGANGAPITGVTFSWASSDTDVATVDGNGLAVARAEGQVDIRVTAGGVSASAVLTVTQVVVSIDISPNAATLTSVGAIQQFQAMPRDANGHEVTSAVLLWESLDPSIASIDANGRASANSFGTTTIHASANGVVATVQLNVVLPGAFTLSPIDWQMPVGAQVQFTATLENGGQETFEWFVNEIHGGSVGDGLIDENGVFSAPSIIPSSNPVVVRAALSSDPSQFVEAPVTISSGAQSSRIHWYLWTPRALMADSNESVSIEISFTGYPSLRIERPDQSIVAVNPVRTGVYAASFTTNEILEGYSSGDLHNLAGFLICDDCERISRGNLFVNVNDDTVSAASVTQLANDVQASDYVVNISFDSLSPTTVIPAAAVQRFYSFFPDDYDFVAVIEQVESFNNRTYRGIQNDTAGIGTSMFDNSATYGSQGRLQGLIDYPISTIFDAAERSTVHEIGHRWMAFLDNPLLASASPHWPVSDLARGIMGFSSAGGQGLQFPFEVQPVSGNIYQLVASDLSRKFNDLELYLMGLVPDTEVPPYVVFRDQNLPRVPGSQGETDTLTIQDIVAVNGPRVPTSQNSQKEYRLAIIVLTNGRLLSVSEMAFFSHMAARGEATTELFFTSGLSSGLTLPFYLATGSRATLITKLLP